MKLETKTKKQITDVARAIYLANYSLNYDSDLHLAILLMEIAADLIRDERDI